MHLSGVAKDLGGRRIVDDLDLDVASGELVCLLGPSGCGKTTTLRMVAGFLSPDLGNVVIDGRDVTTLPPERRPTAMVFQNYALWPHMSVFDNVAFALKLRRLPRAEITRRVGEMLELVGLTHHLRSRPAYISGGEQQRVALARALVQEPAVLLLDEPLSNLDAKLRVRVREDIRDIQQRLRITTLVVTHDQDEALSIADRVAVMNGGRIEQVAPPDTLYRRPATRFVGGFVGAMNSLPGKIENEVALLADGTSIAVLTPCAPGGTEIAVRPEDVVLAAGGTAARVQRVVPRGHFTEVVLEVGETRLRAYLGPDDPRPAPDDTAAIQFRRALSYADGQLIG
ncbi:ABC transporter ATP-binding protein [Pseudonocardia adelaidensis]|uniref:ABC transporter ATP-binding protein n=1 Tax=Pseudonocardia adelaidensis TaxID=648754 RepID=A0ABP9NN93_9PSEU